MKREVHHLPVLGRFTESPPLAADADAVAEMAHRLKTKRGRADYGLRKQTVDPVFGIIKHVMKFRQFLVRGLTQVGHLESGRPRVEPEANDDHENGLMGGSSSKKLS